MYRKDSVSVGEWIRNSNKALLVTGARQIGKTWLIRDEIEKIKKIVLKMFVPLIFLVRASASAKAQTLITISDTIAKSAVYQNECLKIVS